MLLFEWFITNNTFTFWFFTTPLITLDKWYFYANINTTTSLRTKGANIELKKINWHFCWKLQIRTMTWYFYNCVCEKIESCIYPKFCLWLKNTRVRGSVLRNADPHNRVIMKDFSEAETVKIADCHFVCSILNLLEYLWLWSKLNIKFQ